MRLIDSEEEKKKSNIRSLEAAREKRRLEQERETRAKLHYHLQSEMQQRIRDLEADVETLAKNQQRLQQRMLVLVRHLLGREVFNPEED